MKRRHDTRKPARVGEPVQVYLEPADRSRLDKLVEDLGATKSDVLRRGLLALELQVNDPQANPLLRLIGLASAPHESAPEYDVAEEHDRYLADAEVASWDAPRKKKPRKRAR